LQWLIERRSGFNIGGEQMDLEEDGQEGSSSTYKVLDSQCCRKAFKLVFCVGNHVLAQLGRNNNQDVMAEKPFGQPRSAFYFIVEQWMKNYFDFNCEKLPNKKIIHLPNSLSKWDLWNTFRADCEEFKTIRDRAMTSDDKNKLENLRVYPRILDACLNLLIFYFLI
jgi:hypothetical protein